MPTLGRAEGSRIRADPGVGSWLAALAEAQESLLQAGQDPAALARALAAAAAGLVDAHCRVELLDGDRPGWTATCGALDLTDPDPTYPDLTDPDLTDTGQPGARSVLEVPLVHDGRELGSLVLSARHPDWFGLVDQQAATALAAIAAAWFGIRRPDPGTRPPVDPGTAPQAAAGTAPEGAAEAAAGVRWSAPRTPAAGIGEAALQAAQDLAGLGLWEWDRARGRLEWSPEMFRLAGDQVEADRVDADPAAADRNGGRAGGGRAAPDLAGWLALVHPEDRDRAGALLDLDAAPGTTLVDTFRVRGRDGVLRHVQSWATVVQGRPPGGRGGSGGPVVCGASLDVSGQVNDRETLQRLSATDPVTGLGNRLAFDRRMQELLAVPRGDVCLLLLDLDRFKQVNDTLGHQVGDRLLVEVARRLTRLLPDGCMTARMGGDEFVVLPPPGLGAAALRRLAQRIVDDLRAPYVLPDSQEMLVCPASVGVTASAGRSVSGDDLLREADLALYRAKDSGRDRFVVFDDVLRARAQARHAAERSLRNALDQDRLVLLYQPIVDFADGRVVGAEALVRMRDHGGERLLGPDAFIAVAEDTGLVVELDCWVIDTVVAQATAWLDRAVHAAPWLAVNVSARSMEHPRVARRLVEAVGPGGLPKGRIKVELTEHSFLDTLPGGDTAVRQLLSAGIAVGIDDFGTGYSALAYLQRFDLDFMKIDRSFVAEVGEKERADAVVTAIVDLAHAHGMKVTAEGVETPRQARRLREIGCDFAQGYHFGRPGPASRIVRG